MFMKKFFKNFAIVALVIIGLIAIFDGAYFYKQIKYYLNKPAAPTAHEVNPQQDAPAELGEPNQLSIPSLQIIAPIQYAEEANEEKFQEALQNGVVHYPGTAEVGELGNVYIFGHSSDYAFTKGSFKTVFALLPHIEKNSEIIISDKAGKKYYYEVTESFVANNEDVYLLGQYEYKEKLLTLQTSYPVGTALKRYIVKARLKE